MKQTLLLAVLIFPFLSISQPPSYVPTNNLSAWYSFTGNSKDSSINGLDATNYSCSLGNDRFSNSLSAYDMPGLPTHYLSVPNPTGEILDAGTGSFTISLWYKTNDTLQSFIHKRTMSGFFNDWGYSVYNNPSGEAVFVLEDQNGLSTGVIHNLSTNDNNWHHLTGVRNTSIDSVLLYVDGQLVDIRQDVMTTSTSSNTNLFIGKYTNYDDYSLNGSIDDIGIWKRALNECEVQDLYHGRLNALDTSISQSGVQLTSNQNGALYQWVDCDNGDTNITGETNQTFSPAQSGNYKVKINLNGCIKYSDCYTIGFTGINQLDKSIKKPIKILDYLGRETKYSKNKVLIYLYSDGTTKRVFEIE